MGRVSEVRRKGERLPKVRAVGTRCNKSSQGRQEDRRGKLRFVEKSCRKEGDEGRKLFFYRSGEAKGRSELLLKVRRIEGTHVAGSRDSWRTFF